jgi:hypothetical protein
MANKNLAEFSTYNDDNLQSPITHPTYDNFEINPFLMTIVFYVHFNMLKMSKISTKTNKGIIIFPQ